MEQKCVFARLSQLAQRESEIPRNNEDGLSACSHENARLHSGLVVTPDLPTHYFSNRTSEAKEEFILEHIEGRPRIDQNNFSVATPDTPHRSLSNPPFHSHDDCDTKQEPTLPRRWRCGSKDERTPDVSSRGLSWLHEYDSNLESTPARRFGDDRDRTLDAPTPDVPTRRIDSSF